MARDAPGSPAALCPAWATARPPGTVGPGRHRASGLQMAREFVRAAGVGTGPSGWAGGDGSLVCGWQLSLLGRVSAHHVKALNYCECDF